MLKGHVLDTFLFECTNTISRLPLATESCWKSGPILHERVYRSRIMKQKLLITLVAVLRHGIGYQGRFRDMEPWGKQCCHVLWPGNAKICTATCRNAQNQLRCVSLQNTHERSKIQLGELWTNNALKQAKKCKKTHAHTHANDLANHASDLMIHALYHDFAQTTMNHA